MKYDYDIAIIGGGPGGYVAGSYASQFGKKVCVIEKGLIGGCCLNVGCIPTKSILETATRYQHATNSVKYGIKADVSFDWNEYRANSVKIREELRNGVKRLLRSHRCDLIEGEASIISNNSIKVNDHNISAEKIIIATGSSPAIPDKYKEMNRVLTSDSFWEIDCRPKSIVIVGGGVIGCEIASALSRLGSKVTIVEQQSRLLMQFDTETVAILEKDLTNNGVDILYENSVTDIIEKNDEIIAIVDGQGPQTISAEYLLWSTGRKPVIPAISGISINTNEQGYILTDDNCLTNVNTIYCIGDTNGKCMLAHAATAQAMNVVRHICIGNNASDSTFVPQTVFTYPQIAELGVTEKECDCGSIAIGKIPYSSVGYSHIIDSTEGYYKIIRDIATDRIVGAQIVGYNACELIHILAPYINKPIDANMVQDMIFAHPTLSEGIKLAIEASYIRSPQA